MTFRVKTTNQVGTITVENKIIEEVVYIEHTENAQICESGSLIRHYVGNPWDGKAYWCQKRNTNPYACTDTCGSLCRGKYNYLELA
jgi:hypothetical protein